MPIKIIPAPEPNILVIHDNSTVAVDAGATVNLAVVSNDVRISVNASPVRVVSVAEQGPRGLQGVPGPQGLTVSGSIVDTNGHLQLTLNDGTVYDAGYVIGAQGVPGPQGTDGTSSGGIFITDVTATVSGNVGAKLWNQTTIPANIVVEEVTSDVAEVRVHIIVIGASANYTPAATVDGIAVNNLVEDSLTKRYYTGFVDIIVNADRIVTADNLDGGNDSVLIKRAAAGPQITSFVLGALPGTQTELKAGDLLPVSGVVENSATTFSVIDFGAHTGISNLTLSAADSAGAGYKSVTGNVVINSATGLQSFKAVAYNSLGTAGNTATSSNVTLNQTYPVITLNSITYPAGQTGLKNSESATADISVTNYNKVSYSSPNLSFTAPNTYKKAKVVTRTSGTYVNSGTNYTIQATKTSNGAVTTQSFLIAIANISPSATISITGNPTQTLASSALGIDYEVVVSPNQTIALEPTLNASVGTWLGTWLTYKRLLRIVDSDTKGLANFSALSIVGISGLVGTAITNGATYTVAGFQKRTITFPAFSQIAPIGTNVVNISKTVSSYTGSSLLTLQNSTADVQLGYTITDVNGTYSPTGGYLWISDAAFAGSNTAGTLQLDIEESI